MASEGTAPEHVSPSIPSATLAVGTYTIDGDTCSGAVPSDAANYTIEYSGDDYVVGSVMVEVIISGNQTFRVTTDASFSASLGETAPSGIDVDGGVSCTELDDDVTIPSASLDAGTYTIKGSSCTGSLFLTNEGVDPAGYTIDIVGGDFVVNPAPVDVVVSGSQVFGAPVADEVFVGVLGVGAPTGISVDDSGLVCVRILPGHQQIDIERDPPLDAGTYTVDTSEDEYCSGATLTDDAPGAGEDPANYTIVYVGDDYVVSQAIIHVTVTGSQDYGTTSPTFENASDDAPDGVTVDSSALTCTGLDPSGSIPSATLAVGTYTIDGDTCSGAVPSDATNYTIEYVGDDYVVNSTDRTLTLTIDGPGEVRFDDPDSTGFLVCTAVISPCDFAFPDGTMLDLMAVPASSPAAALREWDGDCIVDGSDPLMCSLTLGAGGADVTASFGYAITVTKNVAAGGTVASDEATPVIDCGTTCPDETAIFAPDATVVLTATEDGDYAFAGWTNCPSPTGVTCTIDLGAVPGAVSVGARFGFLVSLTKNVAAGGSVSSSPSGISCGKNCTSTSAILLPGSVTLTATPSTKPAPAYAFKAWSGDECDTSTSTTCSFTLTGPVDLHADFGFRLTVSKSPVAGGTITSSPAGIDCNASCPNPAEAVFLPNATVTLTAAADEASFAFSSWTGCTPVGGTPTQCTITMSAPASVTATFVGRFPLTVTRAGGGTGTVTSDTGGINCPGTCSRTYAPGTTVTLTAAPATGSVFIGWTGCTPVGGTPTQCTLTMDAIKSVTATFGYRLTVTRWGNQGGTVAFSTGGESCVAGDAKATCAGSYASGSVTLTASVPNSNFKFLNWSGACTGTKTTCTVSMTQARDVVAVFGVKLTVAKVPSGGGTVTSTPAGINCGSTCFAYFAMNASNQASVVLNVKFGRGYATATWSGGGLSGTGTSKTVVLTTATTVTVTFTA